MVRHEPSTRFQLLVVAIRIIVEENEAWTHLTAHLAARITSSDVLIHTALTTAPHPA